MILNINQYRVTLEQLQKLYDTRKRMLANMRYDAYNENHLIKQVSLDGIMSTIEELEKEIREYERQHVI